MGAHHGKHERPCQEQEQRAAQTRNEYGLPRQDQFPQLQPQQNYYYQNGQPYVGLQPPNANPQQLRYDPGQQPQVVYVVKEQKGGCCSGNNNNSSDGYAGSGNGHRHHKVRFGC
jgi:hypothetical protein